MENITEKTKQFENKSFKLKEEIATLKNELKDFSKEENFASFMTYTLKFLNNNESIKIIDDIILFLKQIEEQKQSNQSNESEKIKQLIHLEFQAKFINDLHKKHDKLSRNLSSLEKDNNTLREKLRLLLKKRLKEHYILKNLKQINSTDYEIDDKSLCINVTPLNKEVIGTYYR